MAEGSKHPRNDPTEMQALMERAARVLRARHYSPKTAKSYCHWVRQFLTFYSGTHPRFLREPDVNAFLTYLAVKRNVAASTQNQALSALLFFYNKVLGQPLDRIEGVIRARKPARLPDVLSREEVQTILPRMEGLPGLICHLLYGTGMRISEALSLRVKDINFDRREITIRATKGNKDRVTILPDRLCVPLKEHLRLVRDQYKADLAKGLGQVPLPTALARKFPNADKEWAWQWVFPATSHYVDRETGVQHRHHLDPSVVQKAMRAAVVAANISCRATPHTLRHCFATHLLEDGYDIHTVKELLGHKSIKHTEIYLHVLNRGGLGVRSPLDRMPGANPRNDS